MVVTAIVSIFAISIDIISRFVIFSYFMHPVTFPFAPFVNILVDHRFLNVIIQILYTKKTDKMGVSR